jgi:hypothetical protein
MFRQLDKRQTFFISLVVITIALGTALYFNWIPLLQEGFGWDWHYRAPAWRAWVALWPFFVSTLVYIAGAWWLRRRSTFVFLSWIVIAGSVVFFAMLAAYGTPLRLLYERTVSANASGAFRIGIEFESLLAGVRAWPETITGDRYAVYRHMRLSPPGLPAVYWAAGRVMEAFPAVSAPLGADIRSFFCDLPYITRLTDAQLSSTMFGILSPLWAMLTVLPLYDVVRRVNGERSEEAARFAAAVWLFVPAVASFMGSHNTVLPLLATLALAAFVRGWSAKATGWAAVWFVSAGLMTFVCIVMNISMIPLIMFCSWLTLLWAAREDPVRSVAYWRRSIGAGVHFGLGLVLGVGLYRLIAGHHLWELMPAIMDLHLELERPYGPWVALHTRDMFLFFGLPFFLIWLYGCLALPGGKVRDWARGLLITLFILIISGTARGEVGRVWMFFMPAMLLPVAHVFLRLFSRRQGAVIMGLQVFWLVVGLVVLRPILTFQPLPPDYDTVRYTPAADVSAVPVFARFGDDFVLQWYQSQFDPGSNRVTLNLGYEPLQQISDSYLFSALLVSRDGNIGESQTWLPLDFRYPTTCWHHVREGVVLDQIHLVLPEDATAGEWWVSLSAFTLDEESQPHYLPVYSSDGSVDERQIGIGPVAGGS